MKFLIVLLFCLAAFAYQNYQPKSLTFERTEAVYSFNKLCSELNTDQTNSFNHLINKNSFMYLQKMITCFHTTINNSTQLYDVNIISKCAGDAFMLLRYFAINKNIFNSGEMSFIGTMLKDNEIDNFFDTHKTEILDILDTSNNLISCILNNYGNIDCTNEFNILVEKTEKVMH